MLVRLKRRMRKHFTTIHICLEMGGSVRCSDNVWLSVDYILRIAVRVLLVKEQSNSEITLLSWLLATTEVVTLQFVLSILKNMTVSRTTNLDLKI